MSDTEDVKKLINWLDENGIWGQVWFEVKEEYQTMWCLFSDDFEKLRQLVITEASKELTDRLEEILAEHDLNYSFNQPEYIDFMSKILSMFGYKLPPGAR